MIAPSSVWNCGVIFAIPFHAAERVFMSDVERVDIFVCKKYDGNVQKAL